MRAMQRDEGERHGRPMSPNERRVRALGDRALIDAMRAGDDWAFGEFLARFRPVLLAYAGGRIPDELFPECIDEVLEDEALKLADVRAGAVMPTHLRAYLIGAVRKRHLALRRSSARRLHWYEEAAGNGHFTSDRHESVVPSTCSESSLAASRGPEHAEPMTPTALQQLAAAMEGELDAEARRILVWLGCAVPHRQIATWLNKSYDATTKQIWRLCRRLERAAPTYAATLSPAAQQELDRFFRRLERGRRPG
jgi:DNA-directed RNA polymerase specialized sigma24 family protein